MFNCICMSSYQASFTFSVFAMVYFADVSTASYADHMLTHHTVVSAVMSAQSPLIAWLDFQQVSAVLGMLCEVTCVQGRGELTWRTDT